ncbi:LamG domain-containing protein [Fulvivirgaceae bacterium BMA12]|uniref:LamG domain-containing protein n=1 Tax=Agaribacillus aureus TaxID=3051825 RepID=A0ABT8L484_9BACT|nr:LamG domain-containing protein [Fulvivirgaceae bacterium BMA12]
MKIFKLLFVGTLFLALGCNEGYIDDISAVDPGPDETAPQITIKFPLEGTQLQVPEPVTSINIQFEVTDDIEINTISVKLDGTEITGFDKFPDYRKAILEHLYDNVTNGDHVLTITATDVDGKSTSESVNFNKALPYVPLYDGEIFYLPFDGDYLDLVSFQNATTVGNPGFAGESVQGLNAYAGAGDSYLTFPTDGLLKNEFSAVFWMKVNAVPDRAGVLVIGPTDPDNPTNMNNRTSGFRFFRENAGGMQRFKLNVGRGDGDSWFDGGNAADVDPTADEWAHFAFTISDTEAAVYINGIEATKGDFVGVDWTDCDVLSIMSGAPRFTGWNHLSDNSFMDELRLFDKALSLSEIQNIYQVESGNAPGYTPKYDGEVFYMPFEDDNTELVSGTAATEVGSPGFADGKVGRAYAGAADAYLTFPADGLQSAEFSAVFWMKLDADPDRAGILVMGPPDVDNADFPDVQNLRTSGFRFFREDASGMQRVKLNAGNGSADTWVDGGADADVDPTAGEWVHYAFTISGTEAIVYINGVEVQLSSFDGIDWTGCDVLSIMSGAPRFTEWNHKSDNSLMDELRLFNKTLTPQEILDIFNAES